MRPLLLDIGLRVVCLILLFIVIPFRTLVVITANFLIILTRGIVANKQGQLIVAFFSNARVMSRSFLLSGRVSGVVRCALLGRSDMVDIWARL